MFFILLKMMSNNIYYFLNPSLQLNDMCVQEKITSLVKQHVPDAKLSAESEGKLVYTLPLERTNRFPGNVCEHHEIKYINNIHKNNVNDNYDN